jgi:very-short-patch-repair endonuclease
LAARQWGVVSLDELRDCGLSPKAVEVRLRTGRLHPIHRGVYAVGHANPPLDGIFLAAVKACGRGAVLSHYAAAALWGIVDWDYRLVEVTVVRSSTPLTESIRVHRSRCLERADVRLHRGIRVTSPVRTLIDLAAILDYKTLRRAVRQALSHNLVTLGDLARARLRLGPRRGARNLARVLATAAPTRSELEDVVLDLILAGGLEQPDVNVPRSIEGRNVIPDFRWPSVRLVLEADSRRHHDDPLARADDIERQALLERDGDHVERVTWQQAVARPAQTIARLIDAGAPRAAIALGA